MARDLQFPRQRAYRRVTIRAEAGRCRHQIRQRYQVRRAMPHRRAPPGPLQGSRHRVCHLRQAASAIHVLPASCEAGPGERHRAARKCRDPRHAGATGHVPQQTAGSPRIPQQSAPATASACAEPQTSCRRRVPPTVRDRSVQPSAPAFAAWRWRKAIPSAILRSQTSCEVSEGSRPRSRLNSNARSASARASS